MTNKNLIKRLEGIRIDVDNMIEDVNQSIQLMSSYDTESERAHKKELSLVSKKLDRIIKTQRRESKDV